MIPMVAGNTRSVQTRQVRILTFLPGDGCDCNQSELQAGHTPSPQWGDVGRIEKWLLHRASWSVAEGELGYWLGGSLHGS